MNERFYRLPKEKQQLIINAGFQVFSQNSYKKSPVAQIAATAGISKSLLFHYFHNKKELYLFLWKKSAEITMDYLEKYHCYEPKDFFEMMERGMEAKLQVMKEYPYMFSFAVKAFYEKEECLRTEIRKIYQDCFEQKTAESLKKLNPEDFIHGLDLEMMMREIYWTSEGYLWEMVQKGQLDSVQMKKDFGRLISFWKFVYTGRKS